MLNQSSGDRPLRKTKAKQCSVFNEKKKKKKIINSIPTVRSNNQLNSPGKGQNKTLENWNSNIHRPTNLCHSVYLLV